MGDNQRIALIETKTTGTALLPDSTIRYQLGNHLGSASLELDEAAQVITYEEYHPYGTSAYRSGRSVEEASQKRYRYTGKERDEETGFSYHSARYFIPNIGRWISADPIGVGDGINLYAYVKGNPISRFDFTGKYGEAGHFYTVYFISLAAGFDKETAFKNALYTQLPDEIGELDAVTQERRVVDLFPDRKESRRRDVVQRGLHALTGEKAGTERLKTFEALSNSTPGTVEFGFLLHRFGDTYAHATGSGAAENNTFNTGIGHGMKGHHPDIIHERPELYGQYVRELYGVLSMHAHSQGLQPRLTEEEINSYIRQSTYRAEWIRVSPADVSLKISLIEDETEQIETIRCLSKQMMGDDGVMKNYSPEKEGYSILSISFDLGGVTSWLDVNSSYPFTDISTDSVEVSVHSAARKVGEDLDVRVMPLELFLEYGDNSNHPPPCRECHY